MANVSCPHCDKINVVVMTPATVAASCKFCGKALYNRGDNLNATPALDDRIGRSVYMNDDQSNKADRLLASVLNKPT